MNPISSRKDIVPILVAGLLIMVASMEVIYATSKWGPAMSTDSGCYIAAASNFLGGKGLTIPGIGVLIPLTTWPPLFPLMVALLSWMGIDLLQAARLLNVTLLSVNILLAAWLIRRATSSCRLAAIGATLLATSISMLTAHSHVWSEPLFLFLCLASLAILARYIKLPSAALAICFGLATAAACLDKYIGASLAVTGGVIILVFTKQPIRTRLIHTAIAFVFCLLPLAPWFLRNFMATGNAADRGIALRLPPASDVLLLAADMSKWLLPRYVPPSVRAVVLCLAAVATVWVVAKFIRMRRQISDASIPVVMLVFAACYETVLLTISYAMDPRIFVDVRLHLAVFVAMTIFIASAIPWLLRSRRAITLATILIASLLTMHLIAGVIWASNCHDNGQSFTSKAWAASPGVAAARMLPNDARIFTNGPQLIYAQTGRMAWSLPSRAISWESCLPNTHIARDWELMRSQFVSGSYIIYFAFTETASTQTSQLVKDIESNLDVTRIGDEAGCIIFAPARSRTDTPEK